MTTTTTVESTTTASFPSVPAIEPAAVPYSGSVILSTVTVEAAAAALAKVGANMVWYWRGTHDSGSKFYEILLLSDKSDKCVEVRRYGKIANIGKGGAAIVLTHGNRAAGLASANKQRRVKERGGYVNNCITGHTRRDGSAGSITSVGNFAANNLSITDLAKSREFKSLYAPKYGRVIEASILAHFSDTDSPVMNAKEAPPSSPPVAPPPPLPRSHDWGSW